MKTGNTYRQLAGQTPLRSASMEPGHEDREYLQKMDDYEPGTEGLNGARS